MKTRLTILILFIHVSCTFAYDFEADGKYYNRLDGNHIEITSKDTTSGNTYSEKELVIPAKVNYQGKELEVTRIGKKAFLDCKDIHSVIIPEGITAIGNSAFVGCENLRNVELPASLEKIEKFAFALCENISEIIIPPKVTSIEEAVFAGCEKLEFVSLPNKITSIGATAFMLCTNLKSITIPEKVNNLEACAIFNVCRNLKTIRLLSDNPPKVNPQIEKDFDIKQCTLLIPVGSKARYEKADGWKDFAVIEETIY